MADFWSSLKARVRADPSWALFLAFAFFAGFDARLARIAALASALFSLVSPARRRALRVTAPAVGALVYLVAAVAVSAAVWRYGGTVDDGLLQPVRGMRKLTKLLWYAVIPLCAVQVDSRERLVEGLRAFVHGAALAALVVLVANPLLAAFQLAFPTDAQVAAGVATPFGAWLHRSVAAFGDGAVASVNRWIYAFGRASTFHEALAKQGTLADAQRLMTAVPACICLFFEASGAASAPGVPDDTRKRARRTARARISALVLVFAGLVVCAKRGPLLVAFVVACGVLLARLPRRRAFAAVAIAALVVAATPARTRFAALPEEFSVERGGRALMWTKLVPKLHAEYPWGVGFRALTYEKAFSVDPRTELGHDHVHSAPLQTFVELGWIGLAAWALWMGLCFLQSGRLARRAGRPGAGSSLPESLAFAAPFAMFGALWLCSLFTSNLTEPATVLLYAFSTGLPGPSLLRAAGEG